MRSAAVIVFIAVVAAAAIYCARRPTVARGDVLAAELLESARNVKKLDCERNIPIGINGATFKCVASYQNGDQGYFKVELDRNGRMSAELTDMQPGLRIEKSSDPWGR